MSAILELDGMVKRFGGLTATNGVSVNVERGESVGLIGPNGAGKTTIFSLIMGDHRLTEGAIRLKGEAVQDMPTHERIKRGVARTYQVPRPFRDMTVAENIALGRPDATREEIEAALEGAQLAGDLDQLPQGLDTLIGERGVNLSGGQRQRTALARVLGQIFGMPLYPQSKWLLRVFNGLGDVIKVATADAHAFAQSINRLVVQAINSALLFAQHVEKLRVGIDVECFVGQQHAPVAGAFSQGR